MRCPVVVYLTLWILPLSRSHDSFSPVAIRIGGSSKDRAPLLKSLPADVVPRLVDKAQRLLGSPDLAEDAVQEALVALWRAEPWPQRPSAWLAGAVHLRALHIHRTLRRRAIREANAARERPLVVDGSHPEDCPICTAEEHARMLAALNRLRPKHRNLLVRYYFDSVDYEVLASEQGVSRGTIASRMNRAREALRQTFLS
ncbi:MAG: RNA polymerase sigma factor [Planctomycetota bacterium]|nr:MAG: RNA polymerase sigma factor [Planctomycetota bacterium]